MKSLRLYEVIPVSKDGDGDGDVYYSYIYPLSSPVLFCFAFFCLGLFWLVWSCCDVEIMIPRFVMGMGMGKGEGGRGKSGGGRV